MADSGMPKTAIQVLYACSAQEHKENNMAETQAASSPAEVDVFEGRNDVSLAEYSRYRTNPEEFAKPADKAASTPADAPEETVAETEGDEPETVSDSDTDDEAQEPPQKPVSAAEKRIKQLLAEKKELQRKLEAAAKPTQSDSSTAQAPREPQTYQEYRAAFKPQQFVEDYAKAHPDASYEDANAAMADHLLDVRDHFKAIEQRVNAEKQAIDAKVSEARERYENFDEIKETFLSKVISDKGTPLVPVDVLSIINDSDYLADVIFTLANDPDEFAKFIDLAKTNKNKAIRYVTRVESLIADELAKPADKTAARGEDGKFKSAPETKKTQAPKPPSPVGGASARAFDVNDESLSPEDWMRKRNQQLARK